MQISGNVVIVAGGASGLGAGTARALTARGAIVVIADIDQEKGSALAQELNQTFVYCDVCSEAIAQTTIQHAQSLGRMVGLVNCAGIALAAKTVGRDGPHPLELFTRIIQLNLIGSFNLLRLVAHAMMTQPIGPSGERGVLINTASIAAFDGQVGQVAYAASKAGLVGMTLPIARDLAQSGIRCVTIAPGIFDTPLIQTMPQDLQNKFKESTLFPKKLGASEDYAQLVIHIFENDMLNAETIRLDGGLRMPPRF